MTVDIDGYAQGKPDDRRVGVPNGFRGRLVMGNLSGSFTSWFRLSSGFPRCPAAYNFNV